MAKRDWYRRKLNKHWQEFFDRLANSKRFSKEEIRELDRERHDPITRHEFAIGSLIANHLNYFINNQFAITSDYNANTILFVGDKYETVYARMYNKDINDEDSITSTMADVWEKEDKFVEEINFKRDYASLIPRADWYDNPRVPSEWSPQLDFKDGGFVHQGSWAKTDSVNAYLMKNEWVVNAKACRGLGRGSYTFGAMILSKLCRHWEREANKYAHRR